MDKEITLRDLLKEARGERDRIRRNTPSNTFDLKMVIDSMIDSMERLEKRIEEKMEKEKDSYGYSFLFRFCNEILGKEKSDE